MTIVALATAADLQKFDDDLPPIEAALTELGVEHRVVDWHDDTVDWAGFGLVVIRSTWDYTWQLDDFLAWVDRVAAVTTIANPPEIVRWSADKRYLLTLADAGVPTVPTAVLEPGAGTSTDELRALFDGFGALEVVVKPVVSAGSRDTDRHPVDPPGTERAEAHVRRLHEAGRAVLVQPYLPAVDADGETGLVFAGDTFSHGFRKGPLLRPDAVVIEGVYVEEDIQPRVPSADERALAEQALDALAACVPGRSRHDLAYGRVDVAPGPDGPMVLEMELVEPSLFCRTDPEAAGRVAAAIRDSRDRTSPGRR